jgi:hypothetical protein
MDMRLLAILEILLSALVVADIATQTDWEGGPGVWGPLEPQWSNVFHTSSGIHFEDPGRLSLNNSEHLIDGSFFWAFSVFSEDVDGDGDMDVLGAAWMGDEIAWWENMDGSGTAWIKHPIHDDYGRAFSVHGADVDGDGTMDVLGAGEFDGLITWWENIDGSGTTWIEHTVRSGFWGARSVRGVDIDEDGNMDVLGGSYQTDAIAWWENVDGTGTAWTEHIVDTGFDGVCAIGSADVNGDGCMDLLGAAYDANAITWWENVDGLGTDWIEHTIDGSFGGAYSVYGEDVDGDGHMDVLGAAYQDHAITWWENTDGSGSTWIEHTVRSAYYGARSVYCEDVDGDGFMDVLGASGNDNTITWWENVSGSGTDWIEHTVATDFLAARCVYCEDIDGDGRVDILGAASTDDDITWWDPFDFAPNGILESSCLYLGNDPGWGSIDWACTEPPETDVSIQVRASDSPDTAGMGAWSDTLHTPTGLSGILEEGSSFFQYRVILHTTDPSVTPELEEVTVSWNPVGIEGGESDPQALLPVSPNPSSGSLLLRFTLTRSESVSLSVFDLAGRLVKETWEDEFPAGVHAIPLEGLSPGVYFCRMTAGGCTEVQRFVVID